MKPQIAQMGADEETPKSNLRESASCAAEEIPGLLKQKVDELKILQMSADLKKAEFKQRVWHWADKLDVKIAWLGVRPMRNKWASCSTSGHLNFSDELPALRPDLWDYVIVHELLHFSVPNHGKLWKSLMRSHLGEYEAHEGELKRFARNKALQHTR